MEIPARRLIGRRDAAYGERVMPPKSLSSGRLAAFASPSIALAALGLPLVIYLPTFYSTKVGLPLGAVGLAFLVVRLLDIGFDPILGGLMDHTRSRWGRFRPWLALGAPILTLSSGALFIPPAGANFVYLVAALLATYLGYSICYLAHLSWGAALSSDYNTRSRIFAWWQGSNLAGVILVLAIPALLPGAANDPSFAVMAMAAFILATLPLGTLLALAFVREPPPPPVLGHPKSGVKDYVRLLLKPTIRRLLATDLLIGTAVGMNGALFFFYFLTVKQFAPAGVTLLLFTNMIGSLCGTPIWSWLTGRIGKHGAAAAAFVGYAISLAAIDFMPAGGVALGAVILFLAGLTLSAGPFLLRSMMADAGDEDRLDDGIDRTGLLSALFSGTNKLGSALAPGVTFLALQAFDFDPTASVQPDQALLGLRLLYVWGPLILGIGCALTILKHPLTQSRHAEIREALAVKDAQALRADGMA